MKQSRLLFFLLLLALINYQGLANAYAKQDLVSQEKQEVSKKVVADEQDDKTIPAMEDLPFLGRPLIAIEFRGNKALSTEQLSSNLKYVRIGQRFDQSTRERLQTDIDRLRVLTYVDNGYLQAHFGDPELENTEAGVKIAISITEGVLYRAGEITIEDAKAFSPNEVLEIIGLKKGDVIKGYSVVNQGIDRLKKKYGDKGYIQFNADFEPIFQDPAPGSNEAIADIKFTLDEGEIYHIGKISFVGDGAINDELLRSKLSIHEGEPFNKSSLDKSLSRLNRLGIFDLIKEEDINYDLNEKDKRADLTFKLSVKQ